MSPTSFYRGDEVRESVGEGRSALSEIGRAATPVTLAAVVFAATVLVTFAMPYDFGSHSNGGARPYDIQAVPTVAWRVLPDGPARQGHTVVYDSVNSLFWLFGGRVPSGNSTQYYNTLYRKDAADFDSPWVQVVPGGTPPAARAFHTAAYDPFGTRMIVHGGIDSTGTAYDGDTVQILNLANPTLPTWSSLTVANGPSDRYMAAAQYLSGHNAFAVSGGFTAVGDVLGDNYALRFTGTPAWIAMSTTNFTPRGGHALAFDVLGSRLIAYGGADAPDDPLALADPVSLNLSLGVGTTAAWADLAPTGSQRDRAFFAHGFDAVRQILWVQGGLENGQSIHDDLSAMDLSQIPPEWVDTGVMSDGPGDRVFHAGVYDTARSYFLVHGGGPITTTALADTRAAANPGPGGVTDTPTPTLGTPATATSSPTTTLTATATSTGTQTITATTTMTVTVTEGTPGTDTPTPTATETLDATESATPTSSETVESTDTPTPTQTPTETESPSPTSTQGTTTATATVTMTATATMATLTPSPTDATMTPATLTPTGSPSATAQVPPTRTPSPTPTPQVVMAEIDEFEFRPDPIRIYVDDSITWTNMGTMTHTTTSGIPGSPEMLWNSGPLAPGETFTHTFLEPGRFIYYCSFHPEEMRGTVVVLERGRFDHKMFAPIVYQSKR